MQETLSVVDLSVLRRNAENVRERIGNRFFFAVVKADGYGHGAERVALALFSVADGFCVATVDEGARLRVAGIDKPVLVLAPLSGREDGEKARYYSLSTSVGSMESLSLSNGCDVHIAVNTGMNRYGVNPKALPAFIEAAKDYNVTGVYSHLYAAGDIRECEKQYAIFKKASERVKEVFPKAVAHLSASGGILRGGRYLFDGVRCGILLYGYSPFGGKINGFSPVLKVYAPLIGETEPFGDGVGYSVAKRKYKRLYTYRLGYADGFRRTVPLGEGNLCMDAFISQTKRDMLPVLENAELYAKRCGTISYETLCSVTKRSRIIYR